MSTSGSIDFNLNRNQVITLALQLINMIGDEDSDSIDDSTFKVAANFLNLLVKAWQAEGCKIWERKEGILFPVYHTTQYTLSATGDHATNSFVSTTSSAAAISGASTITLTSVTGMTASDNIGIELDDGTRQWTTISSINTGTKVVTLATTLTGAAASGNTVVTYTTKINRPLAIPNARRYHLTSLVETPLIAYNHTEYYNLPNKSAYGSINSFYYDAQLTAGNLLAWASPSNVKEAIKFTHYAPLQDFDASTDNPDFPAEWLDALVLGLSVRLAMRYEKYPQYPYIKQEATEAKDKAMAWDNEFTSVKFSPSLHYHT
jgi:hypothetical protein